MLTSPIPATVTVLWLMPVMAWWTLQMLVLPAGSDGAFADVGIATVQLILALQLTTVCLFAAGWAGAAPTQGRHLQAPALSCSALVPAWPLLLMLGLGTGYPLRHLLYAQLLVFLAGSLFVVAGRRVSCLPMEQGTIRTMQAGLGIIGAVAAWRCRAFFIPWAG